MTVLFILVYVLVLFAMGVYLGRRLRTSPHQRRMGWFGLLLILIFVVIFLLTTQFGSEAQIYLSGGLLMLSLPSLMILGVGFAIGKRRG